MGGPAVHQGDAGRHLHGVNLPRRHPRVSPSGGQVGLALRRRGGGASLTVKEQRGGGAEEQSLMGVQSGFSLQFVRFVLINFRGHLLERTRVEISLKADWTRLQLQRRTRSYSHHWRWRRSSAAINSRFWTF